MKISIWELDLRAKKNWGCSPGGGTHLKNDGYVPTGISNKGAIGTEYLRAKKGVIEYQHIK